jgi:hypothetical protein
MKGSKSNVVEAAGVPASELWDIYATLRFVQLFHQLLPQVLRKVEVVRGDGGVGTVTQVTVVPPGDTLTRTHRLQPGLNRTISSLIHSVEERAWHAN